MNKKLKIGIVIVVLLILGFTAYYLSDYYHAEPAATDYLNGTQDVNVTEVSNSLFVDGPGNDTALIFYQGAKVEFASYLPLFVDLAKRGVDVYIVEMPFNIACFNPNAADEIIDNTNYSNYFISGHSLGGVMASDFVNETNKTDGLILLSSYSTREIQKPVLSIYGTNDKVLKLEKYNNSKDNYKSYFKEIVIEGGNHAQFGEYGNQTGDGIATIDSQDQQKQTANEILNFIKEHSKN